MADHYQITSPQKARNAIATAGRVQSRRPKRESGKNFTFFRFSRKRWKAEKSQEVSRFDFIAISELKQKVGKVDEAISETNTKNTHHFLEKISTYFSFKNGERNRPKSYDIFRLACKPQIKKLILWHFVFSQSRFSVLKSRIDGTDHWFKTQ